MHACPCCGYRTLRGRGDYELCPVCWWEDDGGQPWQISGPNGESLIEAQQRFLADVRPFRRREGTVRAPRPREARDPSWRPIVVTDELRALLADAEATRERELAASHEESLRELEEDPEGAFGPLNADVRELRREADSLSHCELVERLSVIHATHGSQVPPGLLEALARWMRDEDYYRHRPWRTARWLLRYSAPRRWSADLTVLRTRTFTVIG